MTGYDVARALKTRPHFAGLIIAVSGYGQPEDLKKAREAGFDHHCTKPVALAELERLFTGMLQEK
jgi:CheY-like chemotaxis protein